MTYIKVENDRARNTEFSLRGETCARDNSDDSCFFFSLSFSLSFCLLKQLLDYYYTIIRGKSNLIFAPRGRTLTYSVTMRTYYVIAAILIAGTYP